MTLDDSSESGGKFRSLLHRSLRGDREAAWQLLEAYGTQLLHLLILKNRQGREARGDASRLVAQLWELLRTDSANESALKSPLAVPYPLDEATDLLEQSQRDQATVSMSGADIATHNPQTALGSLPSLDEQAETARRRWKHLLVTPETHAQILQRRLLGESIVDIAAALGLAEPVVRYVLQHQTRQEGPTT